ncbi:putative RNA-binding protein EIF1AD [Geosmithia morbida]|uniref:RNA-binding protein EIF1AD n=1 Tax=Geosmithia morbida TaxID=1094350 RepID=A0A9P4Z573_9HYPO|nr:putative RNA-binding protein EIF1AD [Geosmithia morbida]KAF4126899.1 putative RNA-binding protein EIF1AD [Geosmithia morbida]
MGRPKRNVLAAAEESLNPPDSLQPNQSVVRVVKPEGNNLYRCELPDSKTLVLELAQRFRNTIWVRRRGFVLAEMYQGDTQDARAVGEIVNIVRDEKFWRKQSYWPKEFTRRESDSEDESNVGKMPPSDSEDDE